VGGRVSKFLSKLQELDKKIEEALACPCVEDLREGACGSQFTQAFTCYIRNLKADKASCPNLESGHFSTKK
jgi:hypothetical protein